MKKFFLTLVVISSVALATPSFGYDPKSLQDGNGREQSRHFNVLAKETYVSLSTSTDVVCPTDITGTNTYSAAYFDTAINPPVKIRVQQYGTATISYAAYSTNSGVGLTSHTATNSHLINNVAGNTGPLDAIGDVWEEIFYQDPALVFGGGGSAATFTIQVFTQEASPYQ